MSDPILQALERAWARTDELFGLLHPDDWAERGIALRHPFVFYVGHLPAFAWNHLNAVTGVGPFDPVLDDLFERGIDPEDASDAAASAPTAWPERAAVEAYRDGVRARIPEVAERLPALAQADPLASWVLPMVLEHELMHHETLLYMIARMPADRLSVPRSWPGPRMGAGAPGGQVAVGAGPVTLGAVRSADGFGWDNEFPTETVQVEAFTLDRTPVTVEDWTGFLEAGGYREPRWWTDEDWRWRAANGVETPDGWSLGPDGWRVRHLRGHATLEQARHWPVQVSLAEARAFCAWTGDRRLPTEAELHRAAFTTPEGGVRERPWGARPVGPEHGGLDFQVAGPVPVGTHPAARSAWGVDELVGNGWEWTATPFAARPGFEPHLRTYPGYSADFFDGRHFVVFGGSWATDARLVRRSFRNWYQHHYPYVFASFRTVAA